MQCSAMCVMWEGEAYEEEEEEEASPGLTYCANICA
jgi:hypothetical protein